MNPGEDFELMGSDLFDAAADVTISYVAESDSESTASVSVVDGTIAVMPTSEGTAHVTVTATATHDGVGRSDHRADTGGRGPHSVPRSR